MSDSVGRVDLDLGINYKQANAQLNSIAGNANSMVGGAFKKLGATIAAAFAVKSMFDFGKGAVNLASNLAEVQNVVDVTFSSMASEINQFSKTALKSFGLSELSAKKYSSTIGAMMKSSGIAGKQLVQMSEGVTGLTGDMSSFFNIAQQDMFRKIQSGLAGEIEPLRELGINMSVANMEAYALAQGIKKSYDSMTQAEQVLLRYNYLMNATKDAQGDFARTSGSWANQTRLLGEQWKIFQGTMGQGFINILTPVVKMLNTLVMKLQIAAQYFKAFTDMIFGNSKAAGTSAAATTNMGSSMSDAGSSAIDMGKDVKKAGNAIKGSLAGFDQLNTLTQDTAASMADASGAAGGVDLGTASTGTVSMDVDTGSIDNFKKSLEGVKGTLSGLTDSFKQTFGPSFEQALGMVKPVLDKWKSSLQQTFSDFGTLSQPFNQWVTNDLVPTFSTGIITMGVVLSGLLDNSLTVFNGIRDIAFPVVSWFVTDGLPLMTDFANGCMTAFQQIFTTASDTFNNIFNLAVMPLMTQIQGYVLQALGVIESAWYTNGDTLLGLTVTNYNMISGTVQNAAIAISQILQGMMDSAVMIFTSMTQALAPIIGWFITSGVPLLTDFSNKAIEILQSLFDTVKYIFDTLYMGVIDPILNLISQIVLDTLNILKDAWYKWGDDITQGIKTAFENIKGIFNNLWKKYLEPIVSNMLSTLSWLWEKHLKDLVKRIVDFVGKLVDAALDIYNGFIAPLVNWLIDTFGPAFSKAINIVVDVIGTLLGTISDVAGGIIRALGGIIDFIAGVFTGDWGRAWQGVKDIFGGIFDGIVGIFKGVINLIIDGLNGLISGMNTLNFDIPDWVPGIGGKDFGINIPEIPKLANGGLVSSPTLAMVGDNKRANVDPEVISPLSKLQDMLGSSNQGVIDVLTLILEALRTNNNQIILKLNESEFGRAAINAINSVQWQAGKTLLTV